MLVVIFTFDKFKSYLLGSKTIVHMDHLTIKYMLSKKDTKPRLVKWILLLKEFDLKVRDKKGSKNLVTNHSSILHEDTIPKKLMIYLLTTLSQMNISWLFP